ncbi:GspE/PulE family protein [Chitinolyticbacter meiyuanensis]|uniref:GspE/PulE family protein n=1 Tax=Chitinolyticbacter meiyuanensis TaxID=682798 RepID=UPI0011E5F9A7|nr:GspE/PulE family protein [Chitinolyticbacter meiyuanensis]
MVKRVKIRLGDILVQHGIISDDQLKQVLAEQHRTGRRLGKLLIEQGRASEQDVCQALAIQLNIPFISLTHYPLDPTFSRRLPEAAARRTRALLLEERQGALLVGMVDPGDLHLYDELSRALKQELMLAVVMESELNVALDHVYRRTEEISGHARALEQDLSDLDAAAAEEAGQDEAPVAKLVQSLFEDATLAHASDVHIEPQSDRINIRFRINGALQLQTVADSRIAPALAQRLKLIAGLDISERRMPQDGRFQIAVRSGPLDVRISTMPTPHGESIVMRLLSQFDQVLQLDRLGMGEDVLRKLRALLAKSSGMLIVTGPTGSGKTSTLYAAVHEVNDVSTKIVTVEDPIEYRLPEITQIQVNEKIDLSFARVLRSVLRHDPDVILVGEMRDQETAQVGMRAAITGHMVLTTLHTRNAATTPVRLIDMGVPPYLVSVALQGVIAQRLVRLICDQCKHSAQPDTKEREWLTRTYGEQASRLQLMTGSGCTYCNNTGYAGRAGIYEMLEMNAQLTELIGRGDSAAFVAAAQVQMKGHTLYDQALRLLEAGRTTAREVMRLANLLEE